MIDTDAVGPRGSDESCGSCPEGAMNRVVHPLKSCAFPVTSRRQYDDYDAFEQYRWLSDLNMHETR